MKDDSDIEGNHWGVETEDESNFSTDKKENSEENKYEYDIVTVIILVVMIALLLTSLVIDEKRSQVDIAAEEKNNGVVVTIDNVKPNYNYIAVKTNRTEKFMYSDSTITYTAKNIDQRDIDKIILVGVKDVPDGRYEWQEKKILLKTIDVENIRNP